MTKIDSDDEYLQKSMYSLFKNLVQISIRPTISMIETTYLMDFMGLFFKIFMGIRFSVCFVIICLQTAD